MHQHFKVLSIYIKFHEILFSSYVVMAEDGQMDGRTDRQTWRKQYPSNFGGG